MLSYIKNFISENGQEILNKHDSTGNRMIHNIIMALSEKDQDTLAEILNYLLQPAISLKEEDKKEEFSQEEL
jgi:hypothetical protein